MTAAAGSCCVAISLTLGANPTLALLIATTTVFSIVAGATVVVENALNAARYRREIACFRATQQWLGYALAAALTWVWPSAATAMLGFAFAALVTAACELALVANRMPTFRRLSDQHTCEPTWVGAIRRYARPYERWAVFQWLQASCDRWLLAGLAAPAEVGAYAAAYQLGYSSIVFLAVCIGQIVEPAIYARAGAVGDPARLDQADRLRRCATLCFGVLAGLCVAAAWRWHEPIVRLLLDPAYRPASGLLPWLASAASLFGLAQLYSIRWLIRLQPERTQPARIFASLLGVLLMAGGAALAGAGGVAAAQVGFSLLYFIWIVALR
ncbi:MAG TPA: hypothetical protein VNL98_01505 [Gemmatimonadales bacterium]|nr:hypothetical protein [Gemmatimonadales bacterium]